MNEPVKVRQLRLRHFLETMGNWRSGDLALWVFERRKLLQLPKLAASAEEIQGDFDKVLAGRTLLPAEYAAELAMYFGCPETDFLGEVMNGEAAVIDRVKEEIQRAQARLTTPLPPAPTGKSDTSKKVEDPPRTNSYLSRPIRELRGEGLRKALELSGKTPADIATAKNLTGKDRTAYMTMVRACADGKRTLADDEIDFLAPLLGVDRPMLWVRDFTERERERRSRLDAARSAPRRKKQKVAATVRKPTAKAPPAAKPKARRRFSGGLMVSLHLEPKDIAEALQDDSIFPLIEIEGNHVLVRLPLTPELIARGLKK